MIRKCIICGTEFKCSPSDRKITCSKECQRERARQANTAKGRTWKEDSKTKLKGMPQTKNLAKGTLAAQKSPISGPFETNQAALIWTIKSPDGVLFKVRNLRKFVRDNPNLFNGTIDQVIHGFYMIKRASEGKRTTVTQYKGWELLKAEKPGTEDENGNRKQKNIPPL